jgi:hypothetical protein
MDDLELDEPETVIFGPPHRGDPPSPSRRRRRPSGVLPIVIGVGSVVLTILVALGAAFLWANVGSDEQALAREEARAIQLVRDAPCPLPALAALVLGAGTNLSCGQFAEAAVRNSEGSTEDFTWRGQRVPSLAPDEWLVSFADPTTRGHYFLADTASGQVVVVQDDPFVAARVGLLAPETNAPVQLSSVNATITRCRSLGASGYCFDVQGVATNLGMPILELDAEATLAVKIGTRVHSGDGWDSSPDPFRRVTPSRPWPTGEPRTFHYRSRVIPDGVGLATGEALAIFTVSVETVSSGRTQHELIVERVAWGPDMLPIQ